MRLYIKEKAISWGDKFTVKDEYGNDKYTVEGQIFSFGRKLHVFDMTGREVALIKQDIWSWMPRYEVFCGARKVATIRKEVSFFPKYRIDGLGWEISGNFTAHDYEITQSDRQIISIRKERKTWGDSYELSISNPDDEIVALAVVLTIDCVMDVSSGAVSSGG